MTPTHDKSHTMIVLSVIFLIGALSFSSLVGYIYLIYSGKTPDAVLITLASTGLGALGAILVSTKPNQPAPPTVDTPNGPAVNTVNSNTEQNPVHTETTLADAATASAVSPARREINSPTPPNGGF